MQITVIKRNKKEEAYDPQKIISVSMASGLSQEEADTLSKLITKWLQGRGKKEVTSVQIRDRVIVEMQKLNKPAAQKFIWYEKYKDKNYGINF